MLIKTFLDQEGRAISTDIFSDGDAKYNIGKVKFTTEYVEVDEDYNYNYNSDCVVVIVHATTGNILFWPSNPIIIPSVGDGTWREIMHNGECISVGFHVVRRLVSPHGDSVILYVKSFEELRAARSGGISEEAAANDWMSGFKEKYGESVYIE